MLNADITNFPGLVGWAQKELLQVGAKFTEANAGGWLYTNDEAGNPVVIDDGKTDLSILMTAPYLLMDGMNEKGVIMCVLTIDDAGTVQNDTGKHNMTTTSAMRLWPC